MKFGLQYAAPQLVVQESGALEQSKDGAWGNDERRWGTDHPCNAAISLPPTPNPGDVSSILMRTSEGASGASVRCRR